MIRVLIVDDSAVMRRLITKMLENDESIKVVGAASDGLEAIELVEKLKPDVVTLDVEMPRMNGIEALKRIMENNPVPVIMFSALTREGAEITMKALELGAVDFITKDFSNISMSLQSKENELIAKIKSVAKNRAAFLLKRLKIGQASKPIVKTVSRTAARDIVCIGASTGGPSALQVILTRMPKDLPVPIVIAQHMPRLFTQLFSSRLDSICEIRVKEAENREPLREGTAYLAPGDTHLSLKKEGTETIVEFSGDSHYIYRPSVDLLLQSAAQAHGRKAVGVILTGMGTDGLLGAKSLYENGGYVICQNEETSVVFGMPRAVINAGYAHSVLPLDKIPEEIISVIGRI
ncbi:MAG: chemotaxis response regulator protein-glutamate methylesterase [Deltaproteobacteria bacterium]|nr:chemotaxis response regulator protein-glutamate methylesterase [Deltaproteobacteria bacterium]